MPRRVNTDNPAARKGSATVTEAGVVTKEMAISFFDDLLQGAMHVLHLEHGLILGAVLGRKLLSVDPLPHIRHERGHKMLQKVLA